MYIVCVTYGTAKKNHDDYTVEETLSDAQATYQRVVQRDDVYCAAITKVVEATEPHWVEKCYPLD